MKLFGIHWGGDKAKKPLIMANDAAWVDQNMRWLQMSLGMPAAKQFMSAAADFPNALSGPKLSIDGLITDCCQQLGLKRKFFSYEIFEDMRDGEAMPYAYVDKPLDCVLHYDNQQRTYTLLLSKSILSSSPWLIADVCYEFSRAKLIETSVDFQNAEGYRLFTYLAAAYLGYGVIQAQNLTKIEISYLAGWQSKRVHNAPIPYPVLAYAMAVIANMQHITEPEWVSLLPKEMAIEFERSMEVLVKTEKKEVDGSEAAPVKDTDEIFHAAFALYRSGEISKAIALLQEILPLAKGKKYRSTIYNNIGYFKLRLGDYASSINDFNESLALTPDFGYANDNLGFAYIMTGELEQGLSYLEKALQTDNNNAAYSYRNMALYHQKKGDTISAENYFQKAYEFDTPVDLLDYFYGLFLIAQGRIDEGRAYVQRSADAGEIEGVERMKNEK
jgi:tetratricopeptide (TPR) repeat protein